MKLDRNDYWFLDAALLMGINLGVLRSPEVGAILNRSTHGLVGSQVVEVLVKLRNEGLVVVRDESGTRAHSDEKLERAFERGFRSAGGYTGYWYYLTPEGGAAWEALAQPDWHLFSSAWTEFDSSERVIEAGDAAVAEERFADFGADPAHVPVPRSRRDEVLTPWQATYWKRLPSGYRIRYAWSKGRSNVLWELNRVPRKPWYREPKW